jgi:5'-phosphate synthase pdxT subunit
LSTPELKIGVLNLQGAVSEHIDATNLALQKMRLKGEAITVKKPSQIDEIHGLIIPGGESTTIGRVAQHTEISNKIIEASKNGLPIFGTCAGLIVMAKEVYDIKIGETRQPILGIMDVKVIRNAFGRQRESFEIDLPIAELGKNPFRTVFIRAPIIEKTWGDTEILAKYENKIIAAREKNLLATAFHPELTKDSRFHQHFIKMILKSNIIS